MGITRKHNSFAEHTYGVQSAARLTTAQRLTRGLSPQQIAARKRYASKMKRENIIAGVIAGFGIAIAAVFFFVVAIVATFFWTAVGVALLWVSIISLNAHGPAFLNIAGIVIAGFILFRQLIKFISN